MAIEPIPTQTITFGSFWIIFIFFICLSLIFILVGKNRKKEMVLLHLMVMTISLLIAGLGMLQYDVLLTLCFMLFQVISWLMNLMMVKL